jgi:hypothetical protein
MILKFSLQPKRQATQNACVDSVRTNGLADTETQEQDSLKNETYHFPGWMSFSSFYCAPVPPLSLSLFQLLSGFCFITAYLIRSSGIWILLLTFAQHD